MGRSAWKPPPGSIEEFVSLLQQGKLNASPAAYAQALHDAGWIPEADENAAVGFIRGLKEQTLGETRQYRMGRILRSYRTKEGKLDSNYVAVVQAGEAGYFDAEGRLVIRKICLNVIYPDRRVAVLPAREERPPEAPPPAPAAAREAPPAEFAFNPPPQYAPPAREIREPVSRSVP